jgi:hypothetical protein
MELNLNQRRKGLEVKIPDIKKTLDIVDYLLERKNGKVILPPNYPLTPLLTCILPKLIRFSCCFVSRLKTTRTIWTMRKREESPNR